MKTFEGTYTIKWGKNTTLDIRPITFDCMSKKNFEKSNSVLLLLFPKAMIKKVLSTKSGMIVLYHHILYSLI